MTEKNKKIYTLDFRLDIAFVNEFDGVVFKKHCFKHGSYN